MSNQLSTDAGPAVGSIVRIDDATVLVMGQPIDVGNNQPDAANALVHRVGQTLFVIDTGVTEAFREGLRRAVDQVGAWTELVLLNTHGHPDHVANNDVVDELAAGRGATVRHYLPAADVEQMRDPQEYWTRSFERVAGVVPLPATPRLVAYKITSMFTPFRPFGRTTRMYEELPRESITIGSQAFTGWTFADGAVVVIPSQGHCAGHAVVYLRGNRLLHLADDDNGSCALMHDADQLKITGIQTAARRMIADGVVDVLTDGHTFRTWDPPAAAARLDGLLEQGRSLQDAARRCAADADTVDAAAYAIDFTRRSDQIAADGANPNPAFTAMIGLTLLRGLGYRPDGKRWRRMDLAEPGNARLRSIGSVAAGAVGMVPWLLRGRNR